MGGGLGSSKGYTPGASSSDFGGVMAYNATVNPDFHTYTMVSCSRLNGIAQHPLAIRSNGCWG